jgi:hypothetical protein
MASEPQKTPKTESSQLLPPTEPKKDQVIEIPPEILMQEGAGIRISHAQAKQLLRMTKPKYPRTEAQIENTKRLVEANKKRFEEKKLAKQAQLQQEIEQVKEVSTKHREKKAKEKENNIKITVLPKKNMSGNQGSPQPLLSSVGGRGGDANLPPKKKEKVVVVEESESESEEEDEIESSSESEEEVVVVKKKQPAKKATKAIKEKVRLIQQIDRVIQPQVQPPRYAGLVSKMF